MTRCIKHFSNSIIFGSKLDDNEFSLFVLKTIPSKLCYDIKPVRKEEGKSYWKIPLCDDDATREK